ncbi:hypothetical protein GCM10023081_46630 [Arthrobacter ginkgonis]|uniref:Uncharacterized protein n=1 Tax=Arthrobacter ginkgonis TaxID=1630594 RepID=A0ABP7DJ48_9MICC
MPLINLLPRQRIRLGRNVVLVATVVYCLTRAIAYLPFTYPPYLPTSVALISWDGVLVWVWASAWAVAAVVTVADMINRHTRYGLSLTVALTVAWSLGYVGAWAVSGFTSRDWLTCITYLAPAVIIFGFLIKVTALQDVINPAAEEIDSE